MTRTMLPTRATLYMVRMSCRLSLYSFCMLTVLYAVDTEIDEEKKRTRPAIRLEQHKEFENQAVMNAIYSYPKNIPGEPNHLDRSPAQ